MAQGGGWGQGPPGGMPPGGGGWDPNGAPPGGFNPGGFNPGGPPSPYGQPGPYAPPGVDPFTAPPPNFMQPVGSMPLGMAAGFFGGCIGLALVMIIAKGPQTKTGAAIGFGIQLLLGIGMAVLGAATHSR